MKDKVNNDILVGDYFAWPTRGRSFRPALFVGEVIAVTAGAVYCLVDGGVRFTTLTNRGLVVRKANGMDPR